MSFNHEKNDLIIHHKSNTYILTRTHKNDSFPECEIHKNLSIGDESKMTTELKHKGYKSAGLDNFKNVIQKQINNDDRA